MEKKKWFACNLDPGCGWVRLDYFLQSCAISCINCTTIIFIIIIDDYSSSLLMLISDEVHAFAVVSLTVSTDQLFALTRKITPHIAYFVPRNANIEQVLFCTHT